MTKNIIISLIFVLTGVVGFAQHPNNLIRKGNSQFEKGEFSEAEVNYIKALGKDSLDLRAIYNRADAIYKQDNPEEAAQLFTKAIKHSEDKNIQADSYYNLGNSLVKMQKYPEAIESYKNALRINPTDPDTKYNLQYALTKLKEQQQQQQQNQDNKDQQDQENKDQQDQENKDQENKDQQDKNQDQKDQDKKDQGDQNKDQQDKKEDQKKKDQQDQEKEQQEQQPQAMKISKEDAKRLLQALENDEKNTLEKLKVKKMKGKKGRKEKDW
ncbi:MAG: tetratricopeptide repeat protein [Bacteroidales bacterium]|nr:tetratricopeptide repeat protein [Bacteroidales bacterium]